MRSIASKLVLLVCLSVAGFGQTQTNLDTQTKGSRLPSWGTDSGTANSYVVATIAPAGPTLRTGSRYMFVVGHTNTGASTLTADGINHAVKKNISTALSAGDWTIGQVVEVVFDGTNFQWISLGTLSALGSVSCSQLPALTGDVTSSAGACGTTLANIPDLVPQVGNILVTNVAAGATPASGKTKTFVDSTDKRFHDKNDAGTIGTTVVADTGASNNFLTAISAAGVISKSQPGFSNLSGSASCAQLPALTGDTTTSAGSCATTTSKLNGTSFAGTSGNLVKFGASNIPVDSSIAASAVTQTIASGAKALATSAISSAACTSAQTDTATGTATTDVVTASFNGDPTAVTGYVPLTSGMLTIIVYPTSNTVNFKVCNNTSASITPGAITLNWRVVR